MSLPAYAMNLGSFPEMYERSLVGHLFRPCAEILLQRVQPTAGERVLDIACGTGIVARFARERVGDRGRVVGVDMSAPMLAVARAVDSRIDWREGNAGALPIGADEQFDVVFCQQGIQFFPDKPAAAREMRRVLAPQGRLAVATWRAAEEIPVLSRFQRVAERHVGAIVDQRHSFGDATALQKLLADGGFHDVRVEAVSFTVRHVDRAVFIRMNAQALVGMSSASAALSEAERAQVLDLIIEESADVARPYCEGESLMFDLKTNVATARAGVPFETLQTAASGAPE